MQIETYKALSVRQPWAYLIVSGQKDVENRSWATPYRGRVLIHASRTFDKAGYTFLLERKHHCNFTMPHVWQLEYGKLIGSVDLVDCQESHSSSWYDAGYIAWVLADPLMFAEPVAWKGQLGLFDVPCREIPRGCCGA